MKKEDWISIEKQKPKDITPVLVFGYCCELCSSVKIAEIENGKWWESGTGDSLTFNPSHWMPIIYPIT